MTAARYWKVAGVVPRASGADLTLGDVALYDGTTRVDGSATLTCTAVPIAGALGTAGVTFAAADATAPGFALIWDFGSAQSVTELRLTDNGICDLAVWSSVDGLVWALVAAFSGVPVGSATLSLAVDPYTNNTSLLLHCDGSNNSTVVTDSSPTPNTVTANGDAHISITQSKFGGASLRLGGSGYLSIPITDAFQFGAGDFTIEGFICPDAVNGGPFTLFFYGNASNTDDATFVWVTGAAVEGVIAQGATKHGVNQPVTAGVFSHFAFVRAGGTLRMYVNGTSSSSKDVSGVTVGIPSVSPVLKIGALYASSVLAYSGYIDDLRITKGAARYTTDFAPPSAPFGGESLGYTPVPRPLGVDTPPSAPQIALFTPPEFAVAPPPAIVSIDGEDGGWHRIVGTVKEKNLPANTPLARKVQLYHQASGRLVRETWSAASDGSYSFSEVRGGQPYFVVAFDHTGTYRAVIADNLLPEAMTP